MVKTGFRGERKGILTPSLSQGEGDIATEREWAGWKIRELVNLEISRLVGILENLGGSLNIMKAFVIRNYFVPLHP